MVKIFRLISHITIAVVIWKIYKLDQKLSIEKMIKEYEEIQFKKAVEMARNFTKR